MKNILFTICLLSCLSVSAQVFSPANQPQFYPIPSSAATTNVSTNGNAVVTNALVTPQTVYQAVFFSNGIAIGGDQYLTFTQTGIGVAIKFDSTHSGGGSGGIESEHEFIAPGSYSFNGGNDLQYAASSHFGTSLATHEWWKMQYDFTPTSMSNYDSTVGLWGYSKPLGFSVNAGDGTTNSGYNNFNAAIRAEMPTNNSQLNLVVYTEFVKPTGWNQNSLNTGTAAAPARFLSNGFYATAINVTNTITAQTGNISNANIGNGIITNGLRSSNILAGVIMATNRIYVTNGGSMYLGANAAGNFCVFNGSDNQMIEAGTQGGDQGQLRSSSGSVSVDWINHNLQSGTWQVTAGNFGVSGSINPGSLIVGASTNTASFTLVNTNWVSGQVYTNNTGRTIMVTGNAVLTTGSVAGYSQLGLAVPGVVTNYASILSAVAGLTGAMTNALSPAFVVSGGTFSFTNTSSGAGDTSTTWGGQYMVY